MNTLLNEKSYCSQSPLVKLNYTWIIQNFSYCFAHERDVKQSAPFFADACNEIVFRLEISNGQAVRKVSLKLLSCRDTDVRAHFKISVPNYTKGKEKESPPTIFLPGSEEGYYYELCRYVVNNELKIFCEIQFMVDSSHISDESVGPLESNLSKNLEKFLNNEKFCDVILVAGDREFPAHKSILAARSDVFAAMFEHDMEESRLNRVTITDIHHEVFKELLHFIYTDKVPNLDKMAGDLFTAADKYALDGLKIMCEKSISTNLSITTAAKTLLLADLHSANHLKEKTMAFVKANAHEIATTQDWKNLMATHSRLIAEAFAYIFSK